MINQHKPSRTSNRAVISALCDVKYKFVCLIKKKWKGEGLIGLLGEHVTLFCLNYIYTGKLTGVNDTCVLLEEASIVYETGAFDDKKWKDVQALPKPIYVMLRCIEAFSIVK